ncbi:MAG: SMI1/KNR4 family protein [Hungatella sp.]|nr:SMI1/KNR4 family protein [Hungatella sp.]
MSKITDQIDRILKKYEAAGSFSGGASKEAIRDGEKRLGARFPEDYRHFLATRGAGNFGEWEIYGILPEDIPGIPNGIWATQYLRQRYSMPMTYIAFAFDGAGGYFCIDTGESNNGLCPVVLWVMDGDGEQQPKRAAESFESFFLLRLKEQIDKML